jgi:hypothetical protein
MDLTVLAVPDCPNVLLLEQRLRRPLGQPAPSGHRRGSRYGG